MSTRLDLHARCRQASAGPGRHNAGVREPDSSAPGFDDRGPAPGRDPYPCRIVCLTEETTETLYLLGQEHRIVGISGFTVRPPRARREKPRVSAFTSAKIDRIVALERAAGLAYTPDYEMRRPRSLHEQLNWSKLSARLVRLLCLGCIHYRAVII